MSAPQMQLFDRPVMLRDGPAPPLVAVPRTLGAIQPRDYQVRAFNANKEAWKTHRSILDVMATGTGKTVLFAMHARDEGGALVIAHRDSLIKQAAQKLRHVTGEYVGVEKAERKSQGAKYVVASVQTLRGERLAAFAQTHAHVNFVVIDECHRATAASYRAILAAFPAAKVLGVTATADRTDKVALATVFEKVDDEHGAAFRYNILEATEEAWLTPIEVYSPDVSGVSLDKVRIKNGDLDQDQIEEQLALCGAEIAKTMHKACAGRRGIAFTPGVQSALVGAEALNRIVPGCARAIHGEMDDEEKDAILHAHQRGEFPYLLNCAVLVEGYDDPELMCVVLFVKTKSRLRWAQCVGRGTRLWPHGIDHLQTIAERRAAIAASPKPTVQIFDVNYGKHGHTTTGPTDLLGGRYDDAVRARAKEKIDAGAEGLVEDILKTAKAELDAESARKVARIAAKAAKAKGDVWIGEVRPASEVHGASYEIDDGLFVRPFDLVGWLVEQGQKNAASMTREAQLELRRKLTERHRAKLGSLKQVRRLRKLGVPDAAQLSGKRCGLILGRLRLRPFGYRPWNPARDHHLLGVREPGMEG